MHARMQVSLWNRMKSQSSPRTLRDSWWKSRWDRWDAHSSIISCPRYLKKRIRRAAKRKTRLRPVKSKALTATPTSNQMYSIFFTRKCIRQVIKNAAKSASSCQTMLKTGPTGVTVPCKRRRLRWEEDGTLVKLKVGIAIEGSYSKFRIHGSNEINLKKCIDEQIPISLFIIFIWNYWSTQDFPQNY